MYDAHNPLDAQQARNRLDLLIKREAVFDLTEKKQRTLRQNSYLWVTLGYWGVQTGYTRSEAEQLFKYLNKDMFYREKEISGNKVTYIRHISEMEKDELSAAIDRWRNWAADNGVYIPSADEEKMVQLMEMEVERNKTYL